MIPAALKRELFDNLPTTYTFDGQTITSIKNIGMYPLNEYTATTVNIQFPLETLPYYSSIGDMEVVDDTTLSYSRVDRGLIRFTVAADDETLTLVDQFIYDTATDIYTLTNPLIALTSLTTVAHGTFTVNVDFRIINNGSQIEWIKNKPAASEIFIVTYTYIERGYWISSQISEQLMKWIEISFPHYLHTYGASIIEITSATNLSEIYGSEILNMITFDIHIRYTRSWTRDLTETDGTILDSITMNIDGEVYDVS